MAAKNGETSKDHSLEEDEKKGEDGTRTGAEDSDEDTSAPLPALRHMLDRAGATPRDLEIFDSQYSAYWKTREQQFRQTLENNPRATQKQRDEFVSDTLDRMLQELHSEGQRIDRQLRYNRRIGKADQEKTDTLLKTDPHWRRGMIRPMGTPGGSVYTAPLPPTPSVPPPIPPEYLTDQLQEILQHLRIQSETGLTAADGAASIMPPTTREEPPRTLRNPFLQHLDSRRPDAESRRDDQRLFWEENHPRPPVSPHPRTENRFRDKPAGTETNDNTTRRPPVSGIRSRGSSTYLLHSRDPLRPPTPADLFQERERPVLQAGGDDNRSSSGRSGDPQDEFQTNLDAIGKVLTDSIIPKAIAAWKRNESHTPSGFRKVPYFTNAKSTDWLQWRRQFEMLCRIQKWGPTRIKQELFAAMQGEAARAVHDIDVEEIWSTPEDILDLYERRFVTSSDSKMAQVEFSTARQMDDESLLQWHARLRDLYTRAFPKQPVDGMHGLPSVLMDKFITGIGSEDIRTFVMDSNPANYANALIIAQNKEATQRMNEHVKSFDKKKGLNAILDEDVDDEEFSINAFRPSDRAKKKCRLCRKSGHYWEDCYIMRNIRDVLSGKYPVEISARLRNLGHPPRKRNYDDKKKNNFYKKDAKYSNPKPFVKPQQRFGDKGGDGSAYNKQRGRPRLNKQDVKDMRRIYALATGLKRKNTKAGRDSSAVNSIEEEDEDDEEEGSDTEGESEDETSDESDGGEDATPPHRKGN